MIDVDYFKLFNDCYGHQAGDDCLRKVAQVLKKSMVRGTDLAARYGGEEFAYILPETPMDGAINLAQKMRTALVKEAITHAESDVAEYVTVSLGVATIEPTTDNNPHELIEAADKQLYLSKQSGRNRVTNVDLTAK